MSNIRLINRLSYLIGVISLFIILLSSLYYVANNWFPIQRIAIDGEIPHITRAQLSYIAQHRLTGTFFTLNIDTLQNEFRKIPWVNQVEVTRQFPDAITVKISEYKAIARWGEDGLLSSNGILFNGADNNTNLPIFYTTKPQIKDIIRAYSTLSELLKPNNLRIQKIIYDNIGLVKLFLNNNLELVLCGKDFTKDVETLNKYWDQLHQIKPNFTYINMCYKNALSIR